MGGTYRFTMQPPEGDAFHLSGEFLEIQAPYALSYTFRWDAPVPWADSFEKLDALVKAEDA